MKNIEATIIASASRFASWQVGQDLGLQGKALEKFRDSLELIEVGVSVDVETGLVEIVSVDGKAVDGKAVSRDK